MGTKEFCCAAVMIDLKVPHVRSTTDINQTMSVVLQCYSGIKLRTSWLIKISKKSQMTTNVAKYEK